MTHYMRLQPRPFAGIAAGKKTIELRLYDEKRRLLHPGDFIVFTNTDHPHAQITVQVIKLWPFPDFAALYRVLPLTSCGYSAEELATASPDDMLPYYSLAQQKTYGVVGIEIALLVK